MLVFEHPVLRADAGRSGGLNGAIGALDVAQTAQVVDPAMHPGRGGTDRQAELADREHQRLRVEPYVFSRSLDLGGSSDRVIVALDLDAGPKTVFVYGLFPEGTELTDAYSGQTATVTGGEVTLDTPFDLVLLGRE